MQCIKKGSSTPDYTQSLTIFSGRPPLAGLFALQHALNGVGEITGISGLGQGIDRMGHGDLLGGGFQFALAVAAFPGEGQAGRLTGKQAAHLAEWLGYTKEVAGLRFMGQKVFTNGKLFISHDITAHHPGAIWKMFSNADFDTRVGTYTWDLTKRLRW